jgi:hypothetical protein
VVTPPVVLPTVTPPVVLPTVTPPVVLPTVTPPVVLPTVTPPVVLPTVTPPVVLPTVTPPVVRSVVTAPVLLAVDQLPVPTERASAAVRPAVVSDTSLARTGAASRSLMVLALMALILGGLLVVSSRRGSFDTEGRS